jgi:hypothetical protein
MGAPAADVVAEAQKRLLTVAVERMPAGLMLLPRAAMTVRTTRARPISRAVVRSFAR